jgi:hypothetical protein
MAARSRFPVEALEGGRDHEEGHGNGEDAVGHDHAEEGAGEPDTAEEAVVRQPRSPREARSAAPS